MCPASAHPRRTPADRGIDRHDASRVETRGARLLRYAPHHRLVPVGYFREDFVIRVGEFRATPTVVVSAMQRHALPRPQVLRQVRPIQECGPDASAGVFDHQLDDREPETASAAKPAGDNVSGNGSGCLWLERVYREDWSPVLIAARQREQEVLDSSYADRLKVRNATRADAAECRHRRFEQVSRPPRHLCAVRLTARLLLYHHLAGLDPDRLDAIRQAEGFRQVDAIGVGVRAGVVTDQFVHQRSGHRHRSYFDRLEVHADSSVCCLYQPYGTDRQPALQVPKGIEQVAIGLLCAKAVQIHCRASDQPTFPFEFELRIGHARRQGIGALKAEPPR